MLSNRRLARRAMSHPARREIVAVTRMQRHERLARIGGILAAIYEGLVAADDLGGIALHHPRRALVFRNAEQFRMAWHDRVREVGEPLARDDVLVDPHPAQVAETLLVAGKIHDVVVVRRRAAHEEA